MSNRPTNKVNIIICRLFLIISFPRKEKRRKMMGKEERKYRDYLNSYLTTGAVSFNAKTLILSMLPNGIRPSFADTPLNYYFLITLVYPSSLTPEWLITDSRELRIHAKGREECVFSLETMSVKSSHEISAWDEIKFWDEKSPTGDGSILLSRCYSQLNTLGFNLLCGWKWISSCEER